MYEEKILCNFELSDFLHYGCQINDTCTLIVPIMKAINDKGLFPDFGYRPAEPERPIVFYIELYEESSAYYLAARLQKEHWEVNVMPAGSCWILLAHALVSPDHQTLSDLCDYLSDLSEFYGGSFKRWELNSHS